MNKRIRKAFTITELVIVIAVVAILAAVLIPTFSNVVEKANQSAALQVCTNAIKSYQNDVLLDSNPDNDDINGLVVSSNDYYYIQLNNKLNYIGKLTDGNIVRVDSSRDITEQLQSIEGLELGGVTAFSMPMNELATEEDQANSVKLTIDGKDIFIDLNQLGNKSLYFYNIEVDDTKYVGYFVINSDDQYPTTQGANISTQQTSVSYTEDTPIKVEDYEPVDEDQQALDTAIGQITIDYTVAFGKTLSLPATVVSGSNEFPIEWTSKNTDVIEIQQPNIVTINRQDEDVEVTLTARIVLGDKSASREFTVNVGANQYTITVTQSEHAQVTNLSVQQGTVGTTFTFNVTVDDHYEVVKVLVNGNAVEPTGEVYSAEITGEMTITVETKAVEYTVSVAETSSTNATVSELPQTATFGEQLEFTVTAHEHYEVVLVKATVDGVESELTLQDGYYTLTVEGNTEITVETQLKQYSVTLGEHANATVSEFSTTATYGQEITFTVQVGVGYEIASVKVNDEVLQGNNGSYSFEVAGDTVITVEVSTHWASEQNPVEVGDEVIITYFNNDQLTGFAGFTGDNEYGDQAKVDLNNIEEKFVVAVAKGYQDGTFAFITSTGEYLMYEGSSNALYTSNELNANSSWKLSYDADNDNIVKIQNCKFEKRCLQYNLDVKYPRFACYTTTQGQISFYILDRTDGDKVESVANSLVLGSEYTESFTLPTDPRATITWSVSGSGIEIVDGQAVVTKTTEEQKAILKATITLNSATVDKTFEITIPAKAQYQVEFQLTGATVDKENSLMVWEGEELAFNVTPETNFVLVSVLVTVGNGEPQELLPAGNDGAQPFATTITITADTTIVVLAQDPTIPQPEEKSIMLTAEKLGLSGSYSKDKVVELENYTFRHSYLMKNSNNIQIRSDSGVLANETPLGTGIVEIIIEFASPMKNANAFEFTFSNVNGESWSTQINVDSATSTYSVKPNSINYTKFEIKNVSDNAYYATSITINYTEKQLTDADKIDAIEQQFKEYFSDKGAVTFDLPTDSNYDAEIVWESNNSDVINVADGTTATVTRGDSEQVVTLTATIMVGDVIEELMFDITVPAKDAGGETSQKLYELLFAKSNNDSTSALKQLTVKDSDGRDIELTGSYMYNPGEHGLKLGKSGEPGNFSFEINNPNVKKIVVYFLAWADDENEITVQGVKKTTTHTKNDSEIVYDSVEVSTIGSNIVEISSNERLYIEKIEFWG